MQEGHEDQAASSEKICSAAARWTRLPHCEERWTPLPAGHWSRRRWPLHRRRSPRRPTRRSASASAAWIREKLSAAGAAIVALIAKLKALLLLLPKIKLLATAGTALVSVAAYSLIWGWEFAAGFVVLIFIHEMGHVFALRRHGIKASAPMFVPFMGAVIWARSLGDDALTEARVGLAGPLSSAPPPPRSSRSSAYATHSACSGARLRRLPAEPLQPAAGRAARRRPGDGGDGALDVVHRLRRARHAASSSSPTRSF